MHDTAPTAVCTWPSWVRKKAGPRKPIVCATLRTRVTLCPRAIAASAIHPAALAATTMVTQGRTE
jgi:hypothetical protein